MQTSKDKNLQEVVFFKESDLMLSQRNCKISWKKLTKIIICLF